MHARGDVASHRAGVAADLAAAAASGAEAIGELAHQAPPCFRIAARTRSGVAGTRVMRTPVAWWMALRIAGAVGISACSPTPLAPKGPAGRGILDQDAVDRRHVADGGDQVVVQVLAAAGEEFLHQREADALGDAALDLALDEGRVDGAADIVRGDDLQDPRRAEIAIDLELGEMRAEAVDRIRLALAVRIEGRRRRIEGLFRRGDVTVRVLRQVGERDRAHALAVLDDQRFVVEAEARVRAGIGEAQKRVAEARGPRARPPCR